MARTKKVLPAVSLDPTEEEAAKVKTSVEKIRASNGNRTRGNFSDNRGPGFMANNPSRPTEELVTTQVASGKRAPITLPMPDGLVSEDIISPEKPNVPTVKTYYVEAEQARLSVTQLDAIDKLANLAQRHSVADTAAALGVTTQTIYTWLNQPLFQSLLEERTRANFYNIGRIKLFKVYDDELGKSKPGSRVLEQVAKTLGLYSDGDTTNVQVNIEQYGNQTELNSDV